MTTKKTETEILFPETQIKLSSGAITVVSPFNFGQTGRALRILAPVSSALDIQITGGELSFANVNVAVLVYALTENDCEGAFELVVLSTGMPIESIKKLSNEDGFALLKAVFEVAIMPTLDLLKKQMGGKKVAPAKDGQITSST